MTLRFLKQKTPRFSCRVAYCKVGTDLLSQGRVAAYQQFGFIQRVLSLFKISSRSSVFGILGKDRRKIDRGGGNIPSSVKIKSQCVFYYQGFATLSGPGFSTLSGRPRCQNLRNCCWYYKASCDGINFVLRTFRCCCVIDCHRVTSDDKQQNGRHVRNYYVNFAGISLRNLGHFTILFIRSGNSQKMLHQHRPDDNTVSKCEDIN